MFTLAIIALIIAQETKAIAMADNKNKITPSILPGFMELLPRGQLAFNSMMRTIQESFELFGFVPLDTPIIEKAEVLTAKAGEETERQIYCFKKGDNNLALRFDLTVPLARYVSEHINEINFPFRRYQIGKVYRGEKPQKGRFREFYQCDIDIIGKDTLDLVNDAEILATVYFTFNRLNLGNFLIRINNRKILTGFIEELRLKEKATGVLRIIDGLEKSGEEIAKNELKELGLDPSNIDKILSLLAIKGDSSTTLKALENLQIANAVFLEGLKDLKEVIKYIKYLDIPESNWIVDLTIARGLDYYTGTVYETILTEYPQIGSVCSGGRYDNLAEYYTDQKLPGVGISLGLTRLFYQLNELNRIKKDVSTPTKFLILPLSGFLSEAFRMATKIRTSGIPTEVYTDETSNIRKKLDYANKIGVPFVGILGENEIKEKEITIKNMKTGEQQLVLLDEVTKYLES